MKLTQEQLERIEYAIGFLDGAGMQGWDFLKAHDPSLPELSIIRHGVTTSFIFSHANGTPIGDVHLTDLTFGRYDLTGGFVGSDFDAFVQQLDKGMAYVEEVVKQAREDNHD